MRVLTAEPAPPYRYPEVLQVKLYDPGRTPDHWLQLIHPGQFCIFIRTAETRYPVASDGQPFPDGEASVEILDGLEAAVGYAREIVGRHPNLCCDIYDHNGKSGDPIQTVYNAAVEGKYVGLSAAKRDTLIGLGILSVAASFIVYDAVRDLLWIWGYILGMKLTLVGGNYFVRGIAGICEHRYGMRVPARWQVGSGRVVSNPFGESGRILKEE